MTHKIHLPQLEYDLLREILYFLKPDAEKQVWLVGGSIRDLVAGHHAIPDLDLAVSFDPVPFAREYARKKKAGFVVLDDERQVVRIVKNINSRHYNVDLAMFRAEDIDGDLKARDFTINAMAAKIMQPLKSPELEIYDPLNGFEHLKQKLVIPCSPNLFIDDPLRLMRAFRFAALFSAEFSPELFEKVVNEAHLLEGVSGERIRDEFFKVLSVKNSVRWISLMEKTGILKVFLPELTECKGVEQNEWHHLDVFEHTLLALDNLEKLCDSEQNKEWWSSFQNYLQEPISAGRTFGQALKMGCLLHDLGKPATRIESAEAGKTIFHGHEMEGVWLCKGITEKLRLSTNELHFLQKVVKNHMRPGVMLQQGVTEKRLFRYYSETGRDGLGIALLSLADRHAARGSLSQDDIAQFTNGIFSIMEEFYDQLKKPKLPPLLTGSDLIKDLGMKPGPQFKEILDALSEAQYTGEITTREDATEFVGKFLKPD